MDAKTAVNLLSEINKIDFDDGSEHEFIELNTDEVQSIVAFITEQEKYAELGRFAVEIMERKGFSCEFKYMQKTCETSIGMLGCPWELFCQKRAELLVKS